jgi:hypothetical protein
MPAPQTYSFLDVLASLVGPGALIGNLGSGAAPDEEGITIEQLSDMDEMTIGADGQGFHSLIANKAAKITIRLLKTSPVNAQLATLAAFQRQSSANHGQNTLTIVNRVSGDTITCQQVAFGKIPTIDYSKVGKMIEWPFNAIVSDVGLGAGV